MTHIIGKDKKEKPEDKLGLGDKIVDRPDTPSSGLDLAGTFDQSKIKRYQQAMEKQAILLDKEDENGVDYTHLDFVLSIKRLPAGLSNYQAIKAFWGNFYPFLKNLINNYEGFYDRFRDMIDDQEEVLRNHAELDYKYKWTVEYLKKIGHKDKFNNFIRQQIAEIKKQHKGKDKVMPSEELPDLIIE